MLYFYIFRSAIKAVLEKVTSFAFHYTARGLFERDRFIFALLLAVEVGRCYIFKLTIRVCPEPSMFVNQKSTVFNFCRFSLFLKDQASR